MVEWICPTCGVRFFPAPQHALVDELGRKYCKPTCFLHRAPPVKRGCRSHPVTQHTLDGELVASFDGVTNAAIMTGFTQKNIAKACKDGTKYRGYLWRYVK